MKSRVLIGRPLSVVVERRSAGGRVVGRLLRCGGGRRRRRCRRGLGIGHRDHRRPQHAVAPPETLPQHGGRGRDGDVGRRVVDDGLVERGIERVPGLPERLDAEPVEQPEDPVGHQLEPTGELVVVTGALDVVDDREQLDGEPLGGLVDHQRTVPVHPAPVVGVLGADALEVLGALGQLLLEVSPGRCDRSRLIGDRRVLLAHLLPWGGCRCGTGGAGRLFAGRHPHRTRHRVDAPLVVDDDARFLGLAHDRLSSASSTISASTTSSSAEEPPGVPAAAPSADSPAPAADSFWAYIAPPISCETRATFSWARLMASMSEPPSALRSSVSASPSSSFFSAGILSPFSARNFSVWYCSDSARLRVSASSRRFLSSSACASASFIIRSMSSLGSAEPPVIVIDCSLPVPRSLAWTWTMPLASMSKATSICGTPRGAGGRPVSSNMPSFLL